MFCNMQLHESGHNETEGHHEASIKILEVESVPLPMVSLFKATARQGFLSFAKRTS